MLNKKKCDGRCEVCSETDCPDDFRTSCFGGKCETCSKDCRLKGIGANKQKERRAENFAAKNHSVKSTVHLIEELDIPVPEQSQRFLSEVEQAKFDATRKVVFFYLEHPAEFEQYVLSFFCGKSQSEVAKQKGVTRQNISKKIILERGDRFRREIEDLRRRNKAFDSMTATELKIYQLCGEDSVLNISNIAKQAHVSRQTVYNTLHSLSSKYGMNFTLVKERKEKK